jgi:hypothetical protein
MHLRVSPRHGLISTVALLGLSLTSTAAARTFTCASGDTACLIQSITTANGNGRVNTIHIGAGTYTLTTVNNTIGNSANGLPAVTSTLTIVADAPGASIVRDTTSPAFRLFYVAAAGNLTLTRLSIVNGNILGSGGGLYNAGGTVAIGMTLLSNNKATGSGGGLYNAGGTVTIENTIFSANSASSGGAIDNSMGEVVISDSTFDRNSAAGAGGVSMNGGSLRVERSLFTTNGANFDIGGIQVFSGVASIDQSTFVGNAAMGAGAILVDVNGVLTVTNSVFGSPATISGTPEISNRGKADISNSTFTGLFGFNDANESTVAVANSGTMSVTNSTFANITAALVGKTPAILVAGSTSHTTISNTIIAHDPAQPLTDCSGPVTSLGNNLLSSTTGCGITLLPNDIIGDSGVGTFTDDGTAGNGHLPLLANSLAIDAANPATCPEKDQIGQSRVGPCDIGAIERQSTSSSGPSPSGTRTFPASGVRDSDGAIWTLGAAHEILRDGIQQASGFGFAILWYQGNIYVLGDDYNWYEWIGFTYAYVGPAPVSVVPTVASVVDDTGGVWSIGPAYELQRNGVQMAGGYGYEIMWLAGHIYVVGDDYNWYEWTGSTWAFVGASDPA